MTNLIFRSGLDTIGGTIIEVINQDNRLIFDFGCVFDPASNEEILPNVEGIYDQSSEYNDSVIISHIHLDHIKAMNLIPEETDIYMHPDSIKMLNALRQVEFEGILGQWRKYTPLTETSEISGFKVTPYLIDHDVPGAVAYLIENQDIRLVYTGDLRLHGLNGQLTEEFLQQLKAIDVDLVISESVTISFIEDEVEIIANNQVDSEGLEINFPDVLAADCKPQAVQLFNPYIMGMERLQTFIKLAEKLGKKIAFTPKTAFIASEMLGLESGYVIDQDTYNSGLDVISFDDLDNSYLIQFEFSNREKYTKFGQCQLFQSGGEPLGDFDPRFAELVEFCEANNIELVFKGLGGHGAPQHIKYICEQLDPTYLLPLHGFKRQLLKTDNSIQLLPETGDVIKFENHQLV